MTETELKLMASAGISIYACGQAGFIGVSLYCSQNTKKHSLYDREFNMKIKQSLLLVIVVTAVGMTVFRTTSAQYTGPSATVAPTTVMAILKAPVEDQDVVLTGVLLKKLSKDKYIFSDGSGQIRVEIDSKYMLNLTLDENTRVEIRGEVEKDFLESPEIDVKMIRVLK